MILGSHFWRRTLFLIDGILLKLISGREVERFVHPNPFFMFQLTATVCLQTRANDSSIAEISFERNDVAHVM